MPLALLSGLSITAMAQGAGVTVLTSAGRQMERPQTTGSVPEWRGGYLVSRVRLAENNQTANLFLWDRTGRLALAAKVWPQDAVRVNLLDASGVPERGAVAAGYAEDRKGVIAYFIARIGLDGQIEGFIQTNPFIPAHVCAAEDGTTWAFGKPDGSYLNPSGKAEDRNGWLRQYSFSSGLLLRLFAQGELANHESPAHSTPEERVFLRCSKNKVGIWSGPIRQWITVDLITKRIEKWQWEKPSGYIVNSVALTDEGKLFASVSASSGSGHDESLRQLRFDPVARVTQWIEVGEDGGDKSAPITHLLGADGNQLVHSRKAKSALFWALPR